MQNTKCAHSRMSVIYFKPVLIRLYMTAETLPGKWSVFGFFACLFFTVQPHLVSLSTKISSVFTVVWNKVLPYCTPKWESTGELIRTTTEVIHDSTVSHYFFIFSSVSCHQNSYCGCFVWHLLNVSQLHARLFQLHTPHKAMVEFQMKIS